MDYSAQRTIPISNHAFAGASISALVFILVACGGGGGNTTPISSAPPPTISPPPPTTPSLISGSEAAFVSSALTTRSDKPVTAKEVGSGYLLSRLLVTFKSNATVGQANAAARAIGATRITSSEPGSPLVLLEVPLQPTAAAIQSLAKTLRAQPGVAFASAEHTVKSSVLPEFSPGVPSSTTGLSHLLSNRFPQAWNVRQAIPSDCLPHSVNVYVIDEFGPASTRPKFFSQFDQSNFVPDPNGMSSDTAEPAGHGYDVVATLAAKFDSDTPTGANPFADCIEVHAIEAHDLSFVDVLRNAAHAIAADPERQVIVTSSINFPDNGFCGVNNDEICEPGTVNGNPGEHTLLVMRDRALAASEWARLVALHGFKDKILMTQAAGNVDDLPDGFMAQNYLGFRSASLASPFSLATHLNELKALLTNNALWKSSSMPTLPDLTVSSAEVDEMLQFEPGIDPSKSLEAANLLIVDSGASGETPNDVTQSPFDFLGANVRAVGQGVVLDGKNEVGTSFSTPLVAGLAAYLWNLSPALRIQPTSATADLLKRSSATTPNSPTVPVIDAYAAVLQLDDVPGCCGGASTAPIRLGLMDVNGDGVFDALDLQKFASAYGLANPNTPTIPSARDYSRFDLNGDGYTGGIPIATFDLDVNGLDPNGRPKLNPTDEQIEGYPITFNEQALSDLQILCYYAYSPLYRIDQAGQNAQLRTSLLGANQCVGARITLQLPAQVSSSASLNTLVELPIGNHLFAPAPNMLVEMTPTCATVSPTSGHTDANGAISVTVTPSNGCSSISVQVVARANSGTTPLAQQVVSATVAANAPTLTFLRTGTAVFAAVPACTRIGMAVDSPSVTLTASSGAIENQSTFNGKTLFDYHSPLTGGNALLTATSTSDSNVKGSFTTTIDPLVNLFAPANNGSTLSIVREDDAVVGGASDKYVLHYTNGTTTPSTNSFFTLHASGQSFTGTDASGIMISLVISSTQDDPNFGSPGFEANGTVTFTHANPPATVRFIRFCQ